MFNALVTCYLFLGGTGAGALVVLCLLETLRAAGVRLFTFPDETFARAWPICVVALATGMLCLFADVGRPERVLNLVVTPELTAVTVGAYALVFSLVVGVVFAGRALLDVAFAVPRVAVFVLAVMGSVVGLVAAAYTGVLLQSLASVLFWQTPLLPAVFVLSSLSCGAACVFLAAAFVETRRPFAASLARLARFDTVLVVAEALLLASYVVWAMTSEGTAPAAKELLFGQIGWLFWGGLVVCGMVVPVVMERLLTHGNYRTQCLWIAACLLVGGLALRCCFVQTSAFDVTQMADMLYGLALAG